MNRFWQNWLLVWALGVSLFGLVLAAGAFASTDMLTRALFQLFGAPLPTAMDMHHRFAIGLMGAVSMGWGLTFLIAFKALFALEPAKAAPLWRLTLFAVIIWYLIDSAISLATGIGMNAVSNTVLLILLLIPIIKGGALKN
jgi:hypothetical protein